MKNRNVSFRAPAVVLALSSVFLLGLLLGWVSSTIPYLSGRPYFGSPASKALAPSLLPPAGPTGEHYSNKRFVIINQIRQGGGGGVLVIGDSITESAMLPQMSCGHHVINAGIGGITVAGYRELAPFLVWEAKPRLVIIALGTNDAHASVSLVDPSFQQHYSILVKSILDEQTPVALVTIPPIEQGKYFSNAFSNDLVRAHNKVISTLAIENDLRLLDAYTMFSDESGSANFGTTTDGIHLATPTLRQWTEAIMMTAASTCSDPHPKTTDTF